MNASRPTFDDWWSTVVEGLEERPPDETFRADAAPTDDGSLALPVLTLGETDEVAPGAGVRSAELALGQVLGEGGMGVVYLASQSSLEREVAVKRTRSGSPRADQALVREARFMGQLEHPNVIPVHALGLDPHGHPVLVMKRVQGVSWRELIADPEHPAWDRRLDLSNDRLIRHVHVLLEVCNALAFAHDRGVVHRDLKPDNVMIGGFGEIYVMDWGIAAHVGETSGPDRALLGTPAYMPPELLRRPCVAAPTIDVFLLGACLHEVVTGEPRNTGGTLLEVLEAARTSAPYAYSNTVPTELADLCNAACAADPARRTPSVAAFRDALTAWLRHAGAARLAETGLARLGQLEELMRADDRQPARVHAVLEACRGAFEAALEEWPDHPEAGAALRRALGAGARFDLEVGDLGAAAKLIEDLRALGEDVEPLLEELNRRRRQEARLERLSRELDYRVAERPRALVIVALIAALLLIVATSSIRWYLDTDSNDLMTVLYPIVLDVLLAVILAVGWPALRRNRVNRQAAGALATMGATWLGWRLLAVAGDLSQRDFLIGDTALASLWLMQLAIFVRPWLAAPVPVLVVGGVLTATVPDPMTAFLPTVIASIAACALAFRVTRRDHGAGSR